ncbi:MAG: GreA/GreB family elongation factor [Candidatus Nanopelagicales bacterium]
MDSQRVLLTAQGRELLQARIDEIAGQELPQMRPLLVEDERDERVVADFERMQAEHDRLVVLLGTAGTIDPAELGAVVTLGSRVTITDAEGLERVVRIVDPVEAFLDEERISSTSPLARALMGRSVGDSAEVHAPAGTWTATVTNVGGES